MRRPVIAFYNRFFDDWPEVPECGATPCRFTTGREDLEGADAVVFHLPTLCTAGLPPKRPGQLWVAWSMESRVMCPVLDDPSFMALFDLSMTYERSSDVWYPYFGPVTAEDLRRPVAARRADHPVVFLQSNPHDRCGRREYAAELMRRVKVDSFGSVHRNQTRRVPAGWTARIELYSAYKMVLAFENSFAPDYVTEKLFEPLVAGSVPVYRGSTEVAELAPAPDCYVDAAQFRSARELGAYLNHLDTHDDEYMSYHAWRTRELAPTFRAHLARLEEHPLCTLAATVAARTPPGRHDAVGGAASARTQP